MIIIIIDWERDGDSAQPEPYLDTLIYYLDISSYSTTSTMAPASGSLAESRWSDVESSGSDATQHTSSSQTSQESQANTSECSQYNQEADIQLIAAYFNRGMAPQLALEAFGRICDASDRRVG